MTMAPGYFWPARELERATAAYGTLDCARGGHFLTNIHGLGVCFDELCGSICAILWTIHETS